MPELCCAGDGCMDTSPANAPTIVTERAHMPSFWSSLTFAFVTPLVRKGRKRPLRIEDLPPLPESESAQHLSKLFKRNWEEALKRRGEKSAILLAVMKTVWGVYKWAIPCYLYFSAYTVTSPFLLAAIVSNVSSGGSTRDGIIYAVLLGFGTLSSSFALSTMFSFTVRAAARARLALMTAVFEKSLKMSNFAKQNSTTGETVNLMSNDAFRVYYFLYVGIYLVGNPLLIAAIFAVLIRQVGPSALAGLPLLIGGLFCNFELSASLGGRLRQALAEADKRVKFLSEIISGIRIVKLYAWEKLVAAVIDRLRISELSYRRRTLMIESMIFMVMHAIPPFIAFTVLTSYVALGNNLDIETTFRALAFIYTLLTPTIMLSVTMSFYSHARVSMNRLEAFLRQKDLPEHPGEPGETKIILRNAAFQWNPEAAKPTLEGLSVEISKGELVAVVGRVGSGKSSLLSSIIGEMIRVEGELKLSGRVAFMPQTPFIRNGSVADNVRFGAPLRPKRYRMSIKAAALEHDLDIMVAGDETEIGENGINISGGQKSRISLARMLYCSDSCDIFLFDDPLAAVDMSVGRQIFDRAILGALGKKTRIVAMSSHFHLLNRFDRIIILETDKLGVGRIVADGTFTELLPRWRDYLVPHSSEKENSEKQAKSKLERAAVDFFVDSVITTRRSLSRSGPTPLITLRANYVSQSDPRRSISAPLRFISRDGEPSGVGSRQIRDSDNESKRYSDQSPEGTENISQTAPNDFPSRCLSEHHGEDGDFSPKRSTGERRLTVRADFASKRQVDPTGKTLTVKETIEVGSVRVSQYVRYFSDASPRLGVLVFLVVLSVFIVAQLAKVAFDTWLTWWITNKFGLSNSLYTVIWGSLLGAITIFYLLRTVALITFSVASSRNIHRQCVLAVLRAPIAYFDRTPSGRILNRFSKSVDQMDQLLPISMQQLLSTFMLLFFSLVLICVAIPFYILCALPMVCVFWFLMQYFRHSSRELKRVEAVSRSPIFSLFREALNGLDTIRAFGLQDNYIARNAKLLDTNGTAFLTEIFAQRWLALRLDLTSGMIIATASLMVVLLRGFGDPALAGLALVYSLVFPATLQWSVRQFVETESNMTAVERLYQLTDIEAESGKPRASVSDNWPSEGAISFRNFKLRYRADLDLVLKGISCKIKPREKIGICGRTGAGKSSIMLALFRMVEGDPTGGSIEIDGINIADVELSALRSRLSIIPQESILFSGSIAYNLDPFGNHTEDELWDVLEKVHLAELIRQLPDGIRHSVVEGGANFSAGQCQLLSIGRAFLRRSRVLLLDEATASVDPATDKLLQDTIRVLFADCTVLTIAHRIDTIMDSDRIMVLDNGEIVEFCPPAELLADENSNFSNLLKMEPQISEPYPTRGMSRDVSPKSDQWTSDDDSDSRSMISATFSNIL
eukprot:909822_1